MFTLLKRGKEKVICLTSEVSAFAGFKPVEIRVQSIYSNGFDFDLEEEVTKFRVKAFTLNDLEEYKVMEWVSKNSSAFYCTPGVLKECAKSNSNVAMDSAGNFVCTDEDYLGDP